MRTREEERMRRTDEFVFLLCGRGDKRRRKTHPYTRARELPQEGVRGVSVGGEQGRMKRTMRARRPTRCCC